MTWTSYKKLLLESLNWKRISLSSHPNLEASLSSSICGVRGKARCETCVISWWGAKRFKKIVSHFDDLPIMCHSLSFPSCIFLYPTKYCVNIAPYNFLKNTLIWENRVRGSIHSSVSSPFWTAQRLELPELIRHCWEGV